MNENFNQNQNQNDDTLENQFDRENINEAENKTVYNSVQYSPVESVADYKPVSKGLKVFAGILVAVIVLSSVCTVGYFIGRNSVKSSPSSNISLDLEGKPANTDEMTTAQVYEKVNTSVVGIIVYNESSAMSQASGIVFSKDGYIVTNDHIYSEVPSAKFKIFTYDGTEYDAKFVAGDKVSDLAVLKIDGSGFTPAVFGNSDEVYYGQNVVAVGRPNNAFDASSITRGVVSAVNRRVQTTSSYSAKLIQTDSAINPGSSGGALVNMYGQVIGVTSSKLASVEYDAVGYAIPTTTMKRIVDELISKGRVESRAKLGITYTAINSVTKEIGNYLCEGLLIGEISQDSDLYGKAQSGDYITQINGIEVTSDTVVLDIIEQSKAGEKITVTIVTSKGQTKEVTVTLRANISESSYKTSATQGGAFNFPSGE